MEACPVEQLLRVWGPNACGGSPAVRPMPPLSPLPALSQCKPRPTYAVHAAPPAIASVKYYAALVVSSTPGRTWGVPDGALHHMLCRCFTACTVVAAYRQLSKSDHSKPFRCLLRTCQAGGLRPAGCHHTDRCHTHARDKIHCFPLQGKGTAGSPLHAAYHNCMASWQQHKRPVPTRSPPAIALPCPGHDAPQQYTNPAHLPATT